MTSPTSTSLGRDIRSHIPAAVDVPGIVALSAEDDEVWRLAAPHLSVRNNDSHTLYAYGIARALLSRMPEADARVVRAAILLHDTGWSTVPDAEILEAIAPGAGRPDLIRRHEVEGARIARDILESLRREDVVIDRVVAIIDGHDSRTQALSVEDAIVKDADKLWRVTPHGIRIVSGWFDLTPEESLRITAARVQDALFTQPARAMAAALIAIASIDLIPSAGGSFDERLVELMPIATRRRCWPRSSVSRHGRSPLSPPSPHSREIRPATGWASASGAACSSRTRGY